MRAAIWPPVWIMLLVSLLLLDSCARKSVMPPAPIPDLGLSSEEVKRRLHSQYQEWRSVPYRNGGQSRKGIDCSAFIQLTYWQRFGLKVPRTTRELSTFGRAETTSLRPGDLVLFKTGWGDRHAGIYLENRRFLHVSTSNGVSISKLTEPYWHEHYWQTRRLFN